MATLNNNLSFDSLSAALPSVSKELECGTFFPYVSGKEPQEVSSTRIVKCLYRADNSNADKLKNSYVRVPEHITVVGIQEKLPQLLPHIKSWLESLEDKAIKDLHRKGVTNVYTDTLTLDRIIAELEETTGASRLNKDLIEAWFSEEMEAGIAAIACGKMGISSPEEASLPQLEKLVTISNAYKARYITLASGKASYKADELTMLIGLVDKLEAGKSGTGSKIAARLQSLANKETVELMDLL